jgi:hypothetical protein
MRYHIEQVVLPGAELIAAPTDHKAPIVVRVLKTWPHGDQLRYDLEWCGLEAGKHDLKQRLARKDGSSTADLPSLVVEVKSVLPAGMVEPSEPAPQSPARLDGYTKVQWIAGVLWGIGLLAILFVGRRFRRKLAPEVTGPTLADRMRPLVEAVASGKADTAAQAELERLLVAYWRARLDLGAMKAIDAILAIRAHPEAGALLRQLEAWLHMPQPPKPTDIQALLAPYRHVTADSFAPLSRSESS